MRSVGVGMLGGLCAGGLVGFLVTVTPSGGQSIRPQSQQPGGWAVPWAQDADRAAQGRELWEREQQEWRAQQDRLRLWQQQQENRPRGVPPQSPCYALTPQGVVSTPC